MRNVFSYISVYLMTRNRSQMRVSIKLVYFFESYMTTDTLSQKQTANKITTF